MFGSKKTTTEAASSSSQTAKPALPSGENALNSLVRGTFTEGTVNAESDIRIDGTIKGKLTCAAKVIIGPSGFIDGEVRCQNAIVEGRFTGKINVSELLVVKENAEVIGDVTTVKLAVSAGALFDVTCNMKSDTKPQKAAKEELALANGATK
jgi:cytoskeletal protein CcmA (bactofilin family)